MCIAATDALADCPATLMDERFRLRNGRYPPAYERRVQLQRDFVGRSLRLFDRLDREKDAVITAAEWAAARKMLSYLACEGQPIDLEEYRIEQAFNSADLNRDGQITRTEWIRGTGRRIYFNSRDRQ